MIEFHCQSVHQILFKVSWAGLQRHHYRVRFCLCAPQSAEPQPLPVPTWGAVLLTLPAGQQLCWSLDLSLKKL